jgi:hypothetical protein
MSRSIPNVLQPADIEYLKQLPDVRAAMLRLESQTSGSAYLTLPLTEPIRAALTERLGLDLGDKTHIPMRLIKGDSLPHVDRAADTFTTTYIVYLDTTPGEFIVGSTAYPIESNTAYVFDEGLEHRTLNTGTEPRLLLGPMNELAQPVGAPIAYYPTEADALAYTNNLGYSGSYTVGQGGPFGPYTYWRIASNSNGSSSQAAIYANGATLNNDGVYYLYPSFPCFLEGSKILCQVDGTETYVPVEKLQPGTLVKTSRDGFKPVVLIGTGPLQNPGTDERTQNRLYKCATTLYEELTEDLFLTGCHSLLVDTLTDKQREETTKQLGKIFVTDRKYRLMACIDDRAQPWASAGTYTIWHFALEHTDEAMNYGVYANGGLLVETCSIRTLRSRSNMSLVSA